MHKIGADRNNAVFNTVRRLSAFTGGLAVLGLPAARPDLAAQAADTRAIVFGTRHAVALKNNGDVLTWGDNVTCQLGRVGGNRSATPGQVLRNIKEVAAHTLALAPSARSRSSSIARASSSCRRPVKARS